MGSAGLVGAGVGVAPNSESAPSQSSSGLLSSICFGVRSLFGLGSRAQERKKRDALRDELISVGERLRVEFERHEGKCEAASELSSGSRAIGLGNRAAIYYNAARAVYKLTYGCKPSERQDQVEALELGYDRAGGAGNAELTDLMRVFKNLALGTAKSPILG